MIDPRGNKLYSNVNSVTWRRNLYDFLAYIYYMNCNSHFDRNWWP